MALAWIALPAEKHYLAPMCMVGALVLPWDHMRLALLAVDHGSGSFARYNFCRLVAAALVPLFLVILWMNGQHALLPAVLCVVLASLIGLIVQVFTGPRISLRGASNPPLRALAKEGIPYTLGILANNFYGRLDALLILWLADLTAQGNYAAAVPTAGLMLVVPATLELFAFNVGARPDYSPSRRRIIAAGGALVLFQVVSALAFALLLEPMMLLVFGEAFRAAIPFARALLPALALNGCAMLAEGFLRGRGKPHQVTIGNVLGIVALAIAAYALYGRYQALAVPLAAGVSRAVCFIYLAAAAVADVWTHGPPSSGLSTAEGRA
jgi:O-antigen/teichoic acid export membrane protein